MVLYLIACALPVLELHGDNNPKDIMLGLRAMALGWSGIFAGIVAWYANPIAVLAIVFGIFRKPVVAAIIGLVAVAIACTTWSIIGRVLPGDEGNVTHMSVVELLPGFYVWLASLAAVPVAALIQKLSA